MDAMSILGAAVCGSLQKCKASLKRDSSKVCSRIVFMTVGYAGIDRTLRQLQIVLV